MRVQESILTRFFIAILLLFILPVVAFGDPVESPYHLRDMHHHPWFFEVLTSSLVGWVIGLVKGFSGTKDWLAGYWPAAPKGLVFVLDLIAFVGVGAYFGTGIYNPSNFLAAMAAGLTWPIGPGLLATK